MHKNFLDTKINLYINYSLIAYAFMIPISKAGTSFFEVLLLILWLMEGSFKEKFNHYKSNPLIILLSLLFAYSILSLFWASSLSHGLDYISKYKHFFIIFIIFTSFDKRYLQHILSAFLLSIFLSEIISYGIFFELWTFKDVPRSLPTPFLNHVDYSVYLSFSAIILLNRILHESDFKYKVAYSMFTLSIVTNLFMNGGKTGQLIFLISIIIVFLQNMQNKFKAFILSALLLVSISGIAYQSSPIFHDRVNLLLHDISSMIYNKDFTGSMPIRISFWIMGVDELTDKLSFGNGIGNELINLDYYAKKHNFDAEFLRPYGDFHNMYLTYGIQLGQLGLILFLLIFKALASLKFHTKQYRDLNTIFIVTFMLWSFIGTSFHLMDAMTFFALFAGLFNRISFIERSSSKQLRH